MGRIYETEDPIKVGRSQNMSWKTIDKQMKNDTGPFPCHFGGIASITHSRMKRPMVKERKNIELMRLDLEGDPPRASVR